MSGPETASKRVTQKELAAALGVTSAAITKARGIGRVRRGDDGLYDLAESVACFRESRSGGAAAPSTSSASPPLAAVGARAPTARPPPVVRPRSGEPSTLLDFKTLQTQELWLKAKLEREHRQGELVERAAVDSEWQTVAIRVRDAMLQIPYALAPQLAAETDPRVIRDLLRESIEHALTRLCDSMADESDDEADELEDDESDEHDDADHDEAQVVA